MDETCPAADAKPQMLRVAFERAAMPHRDAALNLAYWILRSREEAEDVVQEAYLRAFRFFDGYRGGDARSWILTIVRNTGYAWLKRNRPVELVALPEDPADDGAMAVDAERTLALRADMRHLADLVERLPTAFREVLILRELQGLGYREIATIIGTPIGTVMSRLARARALLQRAWTEAARKECGNGL